MNTTSLYALTMRTVRTPLSTKKDLEIWTIGSISMPKFPAVALKFLFGKFGSHVPPDLRL